MKKTIRSIAIYSLLITIISHSFLFLLAIIFSYNSFKISIIHTYHGILFFYNYFMNFLFDYDNIAIGITISAISDYCLCLFCLTVLTKLSGKTIRWYTAIISFFIIELLKIAVMSVLLSQQTSSL